MVHDVTQYVDRFYVPKDSSRVLFIIKDLILYFIYTKNTNKKTGIVNI